LDSTWISRPAAEGSLSAMEKYTFAQSLELDDADEKMIRVGLIGFWKLKEDGCLISFIGAL
jgi:hypothetical protein